MVNVQINKEKGRLCSLLQVSTSESLGDLLEGLLFALDLLVEEPTLTVVVRTRQLLGTVMV